MQDDRQLQSLLLECSLNQIEKLKRLSPLAH